MDQSQNFEISREILDYHNEEDLKFKASSGLSEEIVRQISKDKNEPEWMLREEA